MKKYVLAVCFALLLFIKGKAQEVIVHVSRGYLDTLYRRYPLRADTLCPNCFRWDTPYFQSIADVKLHQAMVVHAVYTTQMSHAADSLRYARKGVMGAWRHLPNMPDENKVYSMANQGLIGTSKMEKGHFSAWELNAYSLDAALLSDTYTFNAAFEIAAQNIGTELGVEYLQRFLVGEVKGRRRPAGLPLYSQVEYWKGAWGSKGTFTDGQTTDNYPAVYWNLLKYGGQFHAYWFPNDINGAGQANYRNFEIPYATLVQRLGWDPVRMFK